MKIEVSLVGKLNPENKTWDIIDVFLREQNAVEACETGNYFIINMIMSEELSEDLSNYENIYFPIDDIEEVC